MTEFTPFDDSQQVIYVPTDSDTGGIDTREIDSFRQGVEIQTNKQRFVGNQPKIWAGSLDHIVNVNTIGQARSFVEFENSLLFEDMPIFNAVNYINSNGTYPLPIIFNDGPQAEEEARMEPITIPFRKNSPEGPFYAHRVAGTLEDGNDFDTIFKSSNRISQFESYQSPLQYRVFLDEGAQLWGDGQTSDKIPTPNYTPGTETILRAFDDTTIDDVQESTQATTDLLNVLLQLEMNLDMDMRPPRTRSANANTFIYGRNAKVYGTDSITFLGRTRGT